MATSMYDHLIKGLVIGNSNTGKTSLLFRFADNSFNPRHIKTIGIDFKIRYLKMESEEKQNIIKMQIWDTAGDPRFTTITTAYYRGAMAIIIAINMTESLEKNLEQLNVWFSKIKLHAGGDVKTIVVGTFADKCENVDCTQIIEKCEQNNAKFYLATNICDADYIYNSKCTSVNTIFKELAESLLIKMNKCEEERKHVRESNDTDFKQLQETIAQKYMKIQEMAAQICTESEETRDGKCGIQFNINCTYDTFDIDKVNSAVESIKTSYASPNISINLQL